MRNRLLRTRVVAELRDDASKWRYCRLRASILVLQRDALSLIKLATLAVPTCTEVVADFSPEGF